MTRFGEISPQRAKAIKVSLCQGIFKYKHGDNTQTRPSRLRGSVTVTQEKATDSEKWENDIKEAVKFSLGTLREKLTLYMRIPLYVFSCHAIWAENDALILPRVRLRRVLSAYNDGRPFSLDLVGAVRSPFWISSVSSSGS